ncbi:hypothetical protein ACPCK2_17370 [Streptomyces pseudogriseolus]|uniref:hypothetical protein n=1 Tax=Streptomyces pseudogriseolus TaxID=36817 RepID=UPI003FA1A76B
MRRTARALSVAAVAGTVLGALAPAASTLPVPVGMGAWSSPSPCASPTAGHGWQGHTSPTPSPVKPGAQEAEEYQSETLVEEFTEADLYGATSLDTPEGLAPEDPAATDPLAPELAEEPPADSGTALEELIPDAGAEERAGAPGTEGAPGTAADPGVGGPAAVGPGATDPYGTDPSASDPYGTAPDSYADPYAADPGAMDHKAQHRTATDPGAGGPEAAPQWTAPPGPTTSPTASATPTHKPTPSHKPTTTPCPSPTAHQGVQAGGGGAFTDSVPAQVAGGLLMAGAVGAGAHRLLRRRAGRTRH